jgi:hypothetical protein
MKNFKAQLLGQASVIGSLQFVDRLIQAATRVETLHQKVNGSVDSAYPTYIKYGGFLRELTELGFEIARTNPTVTAGANPASEWIENLLEETGSGAGIRLAAEGLGQFFDDFSLDGSYRNNGFNAGIIQVDDALEYAVNLVKASRLIDDALIRNKFQNASQLSGVINCAGNYKPDTTETQGLLESPFTVLSYSKDLNSTAAQLKKWSIWSEQGANANEYELPFASISSNGGKTIFYANTFSYLSADNGEFDISNGVNSSITRDVSISEGGIFSTILEPWTGKISIHRASGKVDTYPATLLGKTRTIYLFSRAESVVSAFDKQLAADKYIPLYLGDQVSSIYSLKINRPDGNMPTGWLEKLAYARDEAIKNGPDVLVGRFGEEARKLWAQIINNPLIAGGGLVAMGALHAIFPPGAVALDAAFMAFFGADSAIHLGSFFIKAIGAKDKDGLKDASNELIDFVGSAILAAISGVFVFSANRISKGTAIAEVGSWFQKNSSYGSEFLKAFSWDNILALRSNPDSLKTFFLLPALRGTGRSDVNSFLTYGENAAASFLSSDLPKILSNPIEGLKSFGNKWNIVGQVIEKISNTVEVSSFLSSKPGVTLSVLEQGVQGVDFLKAIINRGTLDLRMVGNVLTGKSLSLSDVKRISDGANDIALGLTKGVDGHTSSGLLVPFSGKVGAPSYAFWTEWPITDYPPAFGDVIRQRMQNSGTIHFNLDGFDLNSYRKYIADRSTYFSSKPFQSLLKDLQFFDKDNGFITNWEYSTVVGNDNLFNKAIFYGKDGQVIPKSQIIRLSS